MNVHLRSWRHPLSELPAPFRIRIERAGQNATTILVEGELDLSTAPELRRVLGEALAGARPVRLDLSGVQFIDSTGLAAIIQPLRHLGNGPGPLRLVGPLPSQPRKLLELTGVLGTLLPLEVCEASGEPAR
jgi:anti-anti-sigma factor